MSMPPHVTYRPARDTDVERTYAVFLEAADDLNARVGRPPRAGTGAPPHRALALRRSCVRHDGERFWVAEADGAVVGFAIAILRDDVWHLAALHVQPAHQGRGIGSELMRRSMAGAGPTTALTVLTDAVNPISNAIYMRAGMLFQDAMLTFDGPSVAPIRDEGDEPKTTDKPKPTDDGPTTADHPAARPFEQVALSRPRDHAVLAALDLASIGFARSVDHDLWGSIDGLKGVLLVRDGVVRGYAYVAADGAIGPLAVLDPAELGPALDVAAAMASEAGAASIHVRVPGSARVAAEWLVARGARLSGIGLFLASRPVGRLDRYITSGGDAFY